MYTLTFSSGFLPLRYTFTHMNPVLIDRSKNLALRRT